MQLSFLFLLFSGARAFDSVQRAHHNRLRRAPLLADDSITAMSTLAMSSASSLLPSLPTTSLSLSVPLSSSPPSSDPSQSTFASSSALPPSSSIPSSTSSQPSSVVLPSSTPSSSAASTSAVTSISSAPSTSVAVAQSQPASSSTPLTSLDGASAPTQVSPSSVVVVLTSTPATPSSTAPQSSSSGFFANTGAVAGTFTVVGLFSIAGVIAVALLIARRRRSRPYEEDTEFLDKSPDLPANPPITQVTSIDDVSSSDHAHYGAPPMALATPPTVYYPDHAYALHPQAFSPEAHPPPGQHGYLSHPVASTQDYPPQRTYFPEDYDIAYPPPAPRVGANMPNPHEFTALELDSAPVPQTHTALPTALRPSVDSTPSAPKQWASTRFSVDSFYAGIATDTPPSPGRAV